MKQIIARIEPNDSGPKVVNLQDALFLPVERNDGGDVVSQIT